MPTVLRYYGTLRLTRHEEAWYIQYVSYLLRTLRVAGAVAALVLGTATLGFADMDGPRSLISIDPVGPALQGVYTASFESTIDYEWSWFIEPRYSNQRLSLLYLVTERPTGDWSVWYLGGAIGVNYYLSGDAPEGPYAGFAASGGYAQADADTNDGTAALSGMVLGGRVHLGYRVAWGNVSLAPQISGTYSFPLFDGVGDLNDGRANDNKINLTQLSGFNLGVWIGLAIEL